METKVLFLGGTCNSSDWRKELTPLLKLEGINFFNPVVKDWNDEAREKEKEIKKLKSTVELYVITSQMTGVFSIAEVIDASNKKPDRTIFMIIPDGFNKAQIKSLSAVGSMVVSNGGIFITATEEYHFHALMLTLKNIWKYPSM